MTDTGAGYSRTGAGASPAGVASGRTGESSAAGFGWKMMRRNTHEVDDRQLGHEYEVDGLLGTPSALGSPEVQTAVRPYPPPAPAR